MFAYEYPILGLLWSLAIFFFWLSWIVLVLGLWAFAIRAAWRFIGRSESGSTRALFTGLAAIPVTLVSLLPIIGTVVCGTIVFLERKGVKGKGPATVRICGGGRGLSQSLFRFPANGLSGSYPIVS